VLEDALGHHDKVGLMADAINGNVTVAVTGKRVAAGSLCGMELQS
jgi:hypothetical protein